MGAMTPTEMVVRTRRFAGDVIRFCEALPSREACHVIARQLLRAGTSVGANYRAARRARSRPDFIAKLGIVEEEADETMYWLELLDELGAGDEVDRERLHREANELVAIVVATKRTARRAGS